MMLLSGCTSENFRRQVRLVIRDGAKRWPNTATAMRMALSEPAREVPLWRMTIERCLLQAESSGFDVAFDAHYDRDLADPQDFQG